jgi:hypothetical protein
LSFDASLRGSCAGVRCGSSNVAAGSGSANCARRPTCCAADADCVHSRARGAVNAACAARAAAVNYCRRACADNAAAETGLSIKAVVAVVANTARVAGVAIDAFDANAAVAANTGPATFLRSAQTADATRSASSAGSTVAAYAAYAAVAAFTTGAAAKLARFSRVRGRSVNGGAPKHVRLRRNGARPRALGGNRSYGRRHIHRYESENTDVGIDYTVVNC